MKKLCTVTLTLALVACTPIATRDTLDAVGVDVPAVREVVAAREAAGVPQDDGWDWEELLRIAAVLIPGILGHEMWRNRTRRRDLAQVEEKVKNGGGTATS